MGNYKQFIINMLKQKNEYDPILDELIEVYIQAEFMEDTLIHSIQTLDNINVSNDTIINLKETVKKHMENMVKLEDILNPIQYKKTDDNNNNLPF